MRIHTEPGSTTYTAESDHEHRRMEQFARESGRFSHPGVSAILATAEPDGRASITIEQPGDATLADYPLVATQAVVLVFAGLAATVSDLHRAGVAHGDITPGTVAIDPSQRPILLLGEPRNFGDDPNDDLRALGYLLLDLVESLPDPESSSRMADHLSGLAGELIDGDLDDDALAARLVDLERRRRPSLPASRPRMSRRTRGVVFALLILAAVTWQWQPGRGAPAGRTVATSGPAQPGPATFEFEGRPYEVGAVGDIVAVADWACSGDVVPIVLRPSSGEVFVWPDWQSGSVPAAAIVANARTIDLSQTRCGSLAVETASTIVRIPLRGITDTGAST